MSLEFYYRDTDGTLVGPVTQLGSSSAAGERVRLYTLRTTENAEEGTVASSRIAVDDINGDLIIPGLRLFGVKETAVTGSNNFIFAGYTIDRRVSRGPGDYRFRTGVSRFWDLGVVDANTIIEDRVMVGADCNRPAETDVQRITWLLSTAESVLIGDSRYFSTSDPEPMDAVDYRGQTWKGIIDDCAQQSGKNYFITYFGDTATANLPWGVFSLWYGDASSTDYSSAILLSNDLAEVDGSTTFAISLEETELSRDPSRVVSGMLVPYDGGSAYVQRAATVYDFKVKDAVSPAQNVKTAAKANRRGNRMLADVATEEDVITTAFQVPAAQVNDLRPGMRVPFKATHLPGYEGSQWMRCLNRTVEQDSELTYKIKVDLSPTGHAAASSPFLIAVINKGGPGDLTEPGDLSTHAWTKAFWTGNYANAAQFPGPGGPGTFGMWYRAVVPGESATVLTISNSPSQAQSVWVYQIDGVTGSGVTESHGIDFVSYSLGALATVDSSSAGSDSVWFGAFMLQKVNYGQCTTMTTTVGTEVANVNGANNNCPCGSGDPSPPKVMIGYQTGTGVLSFGGTLGCDGAGPGDYTGYGRGYGGLLLPLASNFSIVQQGFDVRVAANNVVTLPLLP